MFGAFKLLAPKFPSNRDNVDLPPGTFPPGDPIYVIPPIEMEPEISVKRAMLAEDRDWGHVNLGLRAIHERGILGAGVLVAICDTGVDTDHPDLEANLAPTGHKDFTGSRSGTSDVQGHGTHCAGIVAACTNGQGLIGAAPHAKILVCKVLSDQGAGASSWIAAGIRHAADMGAGVISLSLGGPGQDPHTRPAIQYAISKGAWVVIAAGNDGGPATSYPGHWPESCAVAATDDNNRRASFSTVNAQNDVAAPGVSILSTLPNGRFGTMSGTSMATPYVAGCLALVRGELNRRGRSVSQATLLEAIRQTSTDIAPAGPDSNTGAGLVNVARLLDLLVGDVPPPPPPPPPPPIDPDDPMPDPIPAPPAPAITHSFGMIWNNTQLSGTAAFAAGAARGTGTIAVSRRIGGVVPGMEGVETAAMEFLNQLKLVMPNARWDPILIFGDLMAIFLAYRSGNMQALIGAVLQLLQHLGITLQQAVTFVVQNPQLLTTILQAYQAYPQTVAQPLPTM